MAGLFERWDLHTTPKYDSLWPTQSVSRGWSYKFRLFQATRKIQLLMSNKAIYLHIINKHGQIDRNLHESRLKNGEEEANQTLAVTVSLESAINGTGCVLVFRCPGWKSRTNIHTAGPDPFGKAMASNGSPISASPSAGAS
ncbi:hypothetical protein AJ80_03273 [Polytolypa hystricis UAMH7299]|uniref:Uncharacterized protein n=1 Tax=Polytolypa hystricis (strain UAMH7299) TaxID=1447883 RepID=A0A2B7YIH7_POLH7|nr:hypothetical protein AJ80_03273 [Polytolypa hystricis UAMH7299]